MMGRLIQKQIAGALNCFEVTPLAGAIGFESEARQHPQRTTMQRTLPLK